MRGNGWILLVGASALALHACGDKDGSGTATAAETAAQTTTAANYSPYLEGDHAASPDDGMRPYYGDTHLHTSYSTDAGMVGANVTPEMAYRFARGEEVQSNSGLRVRLQRPLDFLVIADHAENLGLAPMLAEANPAVLANPWGRKVYDLIKAGKGPEAFNMWLTAMAALNDPFKGQEEAMARPAWARITEAAEKYNQPGRFTTIIGFEWTSGPNGDNLHRNILFRDDKSKADQVFPISYYDTGDPEKLWDWMEAYEKKTGGRMLAIPHNGNLSSGLMFDDVTYNKKPLDKAYALRRTKWEPVYETTQPKGDGETHPSLSPSDEFADFERWDKAGLGAAMKTADMYPREYTREALKRGLAYEAKLGANPFKFGLIGSTDAHTGLATTTENNWFGKVALLEPSKDPIRFDEVVAGRFPEGRARADQHLARETSASGLAAVWAKSNTRADIWDAFARKEVFATTGTRIRVRVFAGYGFTAADLKRRDLAKFAYANGVPMGGDLRASAKAPTLLIQAMKDPDWANLDRVQVVKGWLAADGKTQEKVFDVVWAGDRKPGADGKLPPIGNTVDVKAATYSNSIGAPALSAAWTDPGFDPKQRAFYYVRVLEIPTPRWTTYDAKFFGVALPKDVPASIQERAYTSPIWYSPA